MITEMPQRRPVLFVAVRRNAFFGFFSKPVHRQTVVDARLHYCKLFCTASQEKANLRRLIDACKLVRAFLRVI